MELEMIVFGCSSCTPAPLHHPEIWELQLPRRTCSLPEQKDFVCAVVS